MVELETKRLRIFPITPEQSRLWLEDLPALERQLGCPYRGEPLGEAELRAARRQMDAAREDLVRYPYRTAWFLVHREEKAVIGTAGFLGPPDRRGELEIRYAMGSAYRGRGYMTEAVEAICLFQGLHQASWSRFRLHPGLDTWSVTSFREAMGLARKMDSKNSMLLRFFPDGSDKVRQPNRRARMERWTIRGDTWKLFL